MMHGWLVRKPNPRRKWEDELLVAGTILKALHAECTTKPSKFSDTK